MYYGLDDKDCGKNRIFLRQHDRHPSAGISSSECTGGPVNSAVWVGLNQLTGANSAQVRGQPKFMPTPGEALKELVWILLDLVCHQ